MRKHYTGIGWTPIQDGRFYVYELDWDLIHRYLAPKALASKGKQTKVGPFRVRVTAKKPNRDRMD